MGRKSFGLLTGGVLATLVLAIAPISFAEIFFLEPVFAQTTQDRKVEADRLVQQGIQLYRTSRYLEAIQVLESTLRIYRDIKDRNSEAMSLNSLGLAYDSLGKHQKAIDFYQQAIAIVKQSDDRYGEATLLNNLGSVYRNLGQYQKAIDFYQQAIAIKQQIGNRYGEAAPLNNLGIVYNYLGQYQKAIDFYQQALAIVKQSGDLKGEAASLGSLGRAYDSLGQYQKAIDFYQQSLAIRKQIGDRKGEATALNNLGLAYRNLGQYQKAIDFFQQSLANFKQIGDRNGEATSLNNLGAAYNNLGQYQKAIDFYQQSLANFKQIGDRDGEAASFNNLGEAYDRLGKYQKAIDFYQQSLAIQKQIGDHNGKATSLNNLGAAYINLGQYQKAIDFFQQSLEIQKQIGDRNGEATSLSNLGNAYSYLGQYQKAIDFYPQSLEIQKQIGDRNGEAVSLNSLGFTYDNLGQYQKAIDFYQQSLAIRKQIGDRNGEATSLNNLGGAYDSLGQYQKAIDFLQQSLANFKQIGDRNGEATSLSNLGFALNKLSQPEISILFFKQSINVSETIRKDIQGLKKNEQKSYLETISFRYKQLANLLIKQGRIIEALQVLDLLKIQELDDYLKNIKGNDRTSQGIRLLEPEKANISQLLAISSENSVKLNHQLTSQIQQLPKSEINKVPEYLQNIPQGTVLLYPLILSDRLEIVLFSPNTQPIHRTVNIKKEEFEDLVFAYRLYLKDTKTLNIKDASKQLYDVLIKPIEEDLKLAKATTILYSPDDVLRYVPLAAIYDGKQWLVEKYRISNLIAYNLTDFTPKAKSSPNILAGAYGNGNPKTGQIPLPATIKEVSAISNTFPNTVNLIEAAFSFSATEAQTPKHNILHLATHAEFNGNPNTSFIYFGNGDTVSLSNIKDWKMSNIDLIVLSACQTGSGKLGNGIEILGFGYQVQLAGAKASIASLWKVNDEGTQALMKSFYENIKLGNLTTSEALRQAQIATIHSQQFSHPFYWSAFILIGSGL